MILHGLTDFLVTVKVKPCPQPPPQHRGLFFLGPRLQKPRRRHGVSLSLHTIWSSAIALTTTLTVCGLGVFQIVIIFASFFFSGVRAKRSSSIPAFPTTCNPLDLVPRQGHSTCRHVSCAYSLYDPAILLTSVLCLREAHARIPV